MSDIDVLDPVSVAFRKQEAEFEKVFTTEYVQECIDWYELKRYTSESGRIRVRSQRHRGHDKQYFHLDIAFGELEFPVFRIDGFTWMSLSPMEIQSNFMPIYLAHEDCAVVGLGMGYATLRMMESPEVESIDIYEIESEVITFFKECFGDREGFDKLTFIEGDARILMKGKSYSYVYVDIYREMNYTDAYDDLLLFTKQNDIEQYRFWGFERIFLAWYVELERAGYTFCPEARFVSAWFRDEDRSHMYRIMEDNDWVIRIMEAMDEYGFM